MDALRNRRLLRYGLMAGFIATGAYLAPSIWELDRTDAHFGWFEHVPFILSLVLAYAALRVDDASQRAKLAIGVIVAFALAAVIILGISAPSLAFLGLALAVSYLEWPTEATPAPAC